MSKERPAINCSGTSVHLVRISRHYDVKSSTNRRNRLKVGHSVSDTDLVAYAKYQMLSKVAIMGVTNIFGH